MTTCPQTRPIELPTVAASHEQVRAAHRRYPTGVTVVTAAADGLPVGLAVNTFISVSMDPPLVLVCVNRSARSYLTVVRSPRLGINVLAADQAEIARRFARSGGDKFAGLDWHMTASGAPLLAGAAAAFEVTVRDQTPVATHTIFVAEVTRARTDVAKEPLVYLDGGFHDGRRLAVADGDLTAGRGPDAGTSATT